MYYTKLYFLVYHEFLSVPLWRKSAAMWQGANKRDWEKSLKRELLQKFCCQCLHLSVHDDLRGHFVNGQSPRTNYEADPNTMYHNHTFKSFMCMTLNDKHVGHRILEVEKYFKPFLSHVKINGNPHATNNIQTCHLSKHSRGLVSTWQGTIGQTGRRHSSCKVTARRLLPKLGS